MKGKVLAGLVLTVAVCFSGTAFAGQIINAPANPKLPAEPPALEGQLPAHDIMNKNQKLPMPPNDSMKPKMPNMPGSFDRKLPEDLKPGDFKKPQFKN